MQAFILAAGLGSRLKPFTDHHPKPLAIVQSKPLLQHVIEHLKSAGVTKIFLNLHTMPEQIIAFLEDQDYFQLTIQYKIEKELLETGGGLKNIYPLINPSKPLIIMNADMLSNINLKQMMNTFQEGKTDGLLAVQNRDSNRKLLFNQDQRLIGWKSIAPLKYLPEDLNKNTIAHAYAFSGIQIIRPDILHRSQLKGKFSLIDLYLELCDHSYFQPYLHDQDYLLDVGTMARLEAAQHLKL